MKSMFLAVAGLAVTAVAQDLSSLPKCGQTCGQNMLSSEKSEELGCSNADLKCLCANKNFLYGLRDCSLAICSDSDATKVLDYGLQICKQAGVEIATDSKSATKSAAIDTKTIEATVSTVFSTITSGGSTLTTPISTAILGAGGSDDKSGSDVVSTFTDTLTNSNGDVVTTTGETTIAGGAAASASASASKVASEISAALTTLTSDGSAIIKTLSTKVGSQLSKVSSLASDAEASASKIASKVSSEVASASASATASESGSESSASGTSGSSETSSSDNAAMPQMTAAPAGILAAAGLAVLLL